MDLGPTEESIIVSTLVNSTNSSYNLTTEPIASPGNCGGTYDLIMNALVKFILLGFGTIGNSLSIVVMWSERNKSATAFLLIVLAVVDTLLMFAWLFLLSAPGWSFSFPIYFNSTADDRLTLFSR